MDCATIRQRFLTGKPLSGVSFDEHVRGCPVCADLVRGGAPVGRRLASLALPVRVDAAALTATEALIERERGLRAYLRSRPTWMRWALTLSVALLLLTRELRHRRVPWADLGTPKVLVGVSLLGLLGLVVRAALRPLPIARRSARLRRALATVAWCLPCVLWLAPEAHPGPELTGSFAWRSLGCFAYGSAFSAPVFALLWTLDRGMHVPYRVLSLAAGALALVANLILMLHCPITNGAHLLAGHFSIGLVWFVAVSSAEWWVRRVE